MEMTCSENYLRQVEGSVIIKIRKEIKLTRQNLRNRRYGDERNSNSGLHRRKSRRENRKEVGF